MLAMMSFTLMVMAPIMMIGGIIMALREDVGLSWLVVVAVPTLGIAIGLHHRANDSGVSRDAGANRRGKPRAA